MEKISLNFNWEFTSSKTNKKSIVNLPHSGLDIPVTHFNLHDLEFIQTYVKELDFNAEDLEKHLEVLFEGAAHNTDVYLNDELIFNNLGGYNRFVVLIKPKLGKNILKVVVDSHENKNIPPFGGVVDYVGYAGLYREVYLIKKPINNINNIKVSYDNILANNLINVEFMANVTNKDFELIILDKNQEVVYKTNSKVITNLTKIEVELPSKNLWSIDNPYLYDLNIKFEGATYKTYFGLRDIKFKSDGFYLNGKLIKLIGLNRHQSYPYVGYAMPKGAQIEDANLLKELGVNIVRTAHYPQSKNFIEHCDKIGLLVFTEIPGWQHIGDTSWQDMSVLNVERMIERDYNNPSVIIWGVRINESNDNHDFYLKTNKKAKSLDPNRPTGGVRNMVNSELLEDVYTFNDFIHEGNNIGLQKKSTVTKKKNPYLVTEHNGHMFPTKAYDNEIKRLSHALRHLRVIDAAKMPNNKISGAIGWVFADYQTHAEFGSGDMICHHGVLDIYRNKKLASYSYMAEGSKDDILYVGSNMHIGEYPRSDLEKVYVFTNLDYIKLYKNNEYIKTFYPNKDEFKNLNHPPIVIDDFIGDLIHKNEGLTIKDANRAKKILRAVQKYGTRLPLRYNLMILYLFKKYKMTMDEGVSLFYKYLSNWGTKQSDYKIEGYKDTKLVKTVVKSIYKKYDYMLEATNNNLVIADTYDVTRVVFKKVDQNGEIATYSFDPIAIEVENLELIGPKLQTLNSGIIAFWVKTTKKGLGTIRVKVANKEYETKVYVDEVNN
ncbi:glycoside hydrolase family 2 protein [Haploplasma modicum]|uniref:glycoside hydrolase family 2 protein n=1 Tax=Haploplasma modicum TaxID=2150 RepID=UPI00138AE71A|nr:glycoside hydrolase family 2 TIM barrel-domain containing protein [Haploplasma modicum]